MKDKMSVRQWQEKFRAGEFSTPDCYTQMKAGWYSWVCSTDSLPGRLKKLAKLITSITDPYILDNYYIVCANRSSQFDRLHDEVGFLPILEENHTKSFYVAIDDPRHRKKWSLFTWRYSLAAPEFDCRDIRELIRYIHQISPELQQGISPPFVNEWRTVETYAHKRHGEPWGIPVYRNGEHSYAYRSRQDGKEHAVIVAPDPTAPPPGFILEQAVSVTEIYSRCPEHMKGIYVFCPEDAGMPPPAPRRTEGKSPSRKGMER